MVKRKTVKLKMGKIKNLKIVLMILIVVSVMVIVKTTGKNHFKEDAQNAIEAVVSNNFIISESEFKNSEDQFLVVDLSESGLNPYKNSLKISVENLAEESSLMKLKDTDRKILLVSGDDSKAEKAWVILNQLGLKNVFVLSDEENPEVLKYKFQPDTTVTQ